MSLLWLKVAKWIGCGILSGGLFFVSFSKKNQDRSSWGLWASFLGLLFIWISGYARMKQMGLSMSALWISISLLLSLLLWGCILGSLVYHRHSRTLDSLSVSLLLGALLAMVFRDHLSFLGLLVGMSVSFLAIFLMLPKSSTLLEEESEIEKQSLQKNINGWFVWMGRLEGTSLLLLFFVYMPLKYGAKVSLDGGNGLVGWLHGTFQLFFLVGLVFAMKVNQWSILVGIKGVLASLLPLGTFFFEKKYLSEHKK